MCLFVNKNYVNLNREYYANSLSLG